MELHRRVLIVVVLLTVAVGAIPVASGQTAADGSAAGDALAISQRFFPDSADHVVLVRDDVPVDALAAGFVQGALPAPMVLTPSSALSEAARGEIQRLGATSATIIGGHAAVSPQVEADLDALGLTVTRRAGDTRFGTAEAIFGAMGHDATTGIVARAYPAEGIPTSLFADSIGAGAAAAGLGHPILLTHTDALTPTTRETLETSALTDLLVVGGTAAVSDAVVVELESRGFAITRLGGDDRTETAVEIARHVDAAGPGVTRVVLVDGYVGDAWAAGFAAASANPDGRTVVLLSNGDDLPIATQEFLVGGSYEVVCGPTASASACEAAGGEGAGDGEFFRHVASYDITGNDNVVAEIIHVAEDGNTLIYTDAETATIGFVDITDASAPQGSGTVEVSGDPTSAVVAGDHVLVGVNTSTSLDNPSGELVLVDLDTRATVRTIDLGGQPDAAAVSPSGDYAAIAIENERDEDQDGGLIPQLPGGYLVVVDISSDDPADWTTTEVDLTGLAETAPEDPEVEYVDINDQDLAVVTMQENNHLVVVDLTTGQVVTDFSAGEVTITDIDATEEEIGPQGNGDIQLTETITRRREPDSVGWIDADSFATANEGDYEDAQGELGGARSFTIFNLDGTVEHEAGNAFEHAQIRVGHYDEGRSADKGGEPEGIEVGTYDGAPLLFVGAERTNVVGVYDVTDEADPQLLQVLPTGIGPEGLKAIPSRGLFVATSESPTEAIPALITIWERSADALPYPQIASIDAGGTPIPWVALSGLAGGTDDTVSAVSDSILGVGYIYTVDTGDSPALITDRTAVTGATFDLDLEGIATAPDGGWWLASEGRYTTDDAGVVTEERPNALVRVDEAGAVVAEVELPAALVDQATGSGLEGIAVTGEDTTEFVYVVVQREWADDAEGVVKIGRYDVAAAQWGFVDYALDAVESPDGGWVGLSELTLLPDGTFAVVERDDRAGTGARIKRVYRVDLASADFAPYGTDRPTLEKTLLVDLLDDLSDASIWTPDKLEGLAVTGDGRLVAVTDNDGLDDAVGQTVFLDLGPLQDLLAS